MGLSYNIDFEIVGSILLLVMYGVMVLFYSDQSEVNIWFKKLAAFLLFSEVMDIATAITISYSSEIPPAVNTICNTVYFTLIFTVGYVFLRYIQAYIYQGCNVQKKLLRQRIVYIVILAVLFVNMFTGFLFYFDKEGSYIHGSLYFFVYIVPVCYILFAAWELIKNYKLFKKRQRFAIGLYICLALAGPIMQMLFFPNILLSVFTPSIAVLIILFSMETPDYRLLIKTLAELDALRKSLDQEVKRQTKVAEERREKMERLSDQVIVTLAKTIDAKDKYTNGHSERVAKYSREIARRMGLSEQKQEEIYFMGILHDIGKIGIPDTIINKTEKLTDEEYQMIKRHPEIGEEILKNITEIPNISLGAKYHHEKYDGGGYPNRAAGEEIPLEARIIGIADAYDAMASTRSYRDVLPQEVVRAEIEKGRGTQFDPECTDILLKMMEEDKDYRMRE